MSPAHPIAMRLPLQELVEALPDAMVVAGEDGIIVLVNARAETLFGYTRDEMLGRTVEMLVPTRARSAHPGNRARYFSHPRTRPMGAPGLALFARRKDGSELPVDISLAPFKTAEGAFAITAVRDATDRLKLDSERAARQAAEMANRSKDEFLATMSHELRTPLNAIIGWTKILEKGQGDARRLGHGLEVIKRNAVAQERIINDLLDVSRIVSGKLQLSLRRTELASILHAAADVVRPAADAKGVRVVVDVDPAIGATIADADRLQQILWNLLTNAVRFTPRGGRVTLTGERVGSTACIRVEDTGAGIPAEHLPYLFERFRQVDSSTTRSHGGLGLGLAIVRHLVEAHGGSVEASSDGPGKGSAFTLTLPIRVLTEAPVPDEEDDGTPSWAEPPTPIEDDTLRDVRVLAVEDDPDSLEAIRILLEDAGARVTTTTSAREALDSLARGGAFDVLLSDIGMPDMDGYAFMRSVREAGRNEPAIALTAYARREDAERARHAGYQEHVAKPVDGFRLVATVRAWARGKQAAAQGTP